jgi:membrane protease YdiL (CAAX protease family)
VAKGRALLEVLICSGYPTQVLILGILKSAGMAPTADHAGLSLRFVSLLSVLDAILVIAFVLVFLRANGEHPGDALLGTRSPARETALGLLLVPVSFLVAFSVIAAVNLAAPWLHNVARNPFEAVLQTTRQQVVLAFVVTIAGGLREEIQRAFILRRFEQSLGGAVLGLVLWSATFGLGHLSQGRDVAIATATLGAFWGLVYLRRRSVVSPAVAHAGFNLSEILRHAMMT